MSQSSGAVPVKLNDVISNNLIIFLENKLSLAKELNISLRTLNRWLDDGKVHLTKVLKYPKVKIESVMPIAIEAVSVQDYLAWVDAA